MSENMHVRIEKSLESLKQFCKAQKFEINISAAGRIDLYAELDKSDIVINEIKIDNVIPSMLALQAVRRCGWKSV